MSNKRRLSPRFFEDACLLEILTVVKRQEILIEEIMTKVNDVAAQLQNIVTQLDKAKEEIITRVTELQTSLQNVELPADAEAALASLAVAAQALDDLNPDPEPVAEPAPTPVDQEPAPAEEQPAEVDPNEQPQ